MRLLEEYNIQFEENICYNELFNHSMVVAVNFLYCPLSRAIRVQARWAWGAGFL